MTGFILSEESFLQTILFVVAIYAFVFTASTVLRYHLSPLKSLPGPFWARYNRVWYFIQTLKGNFHETNRLLHKKYGEIECCCSWLLFFTYINNPGPVVRITPDTYSIDDPNAIRIIYGHGTKFIKVRY